MAFAVNVWASLLDCSSAAVRGECPPHVQIFGWWDFTGDKNEIYRQFLQFFVGDKRERDTVCGWWSFFYWKNINIDLYFFFLLVLQFLTTYPRHIIFLQTSVRFTTCDIKCWFIGNNKCVCCWLTPRALWATVDELEVDDDHQLDACHKNSDHQLAINFYQITINLVIKQSNSYRIVYKDLSQEEKKVLQRNRVL